MNYRHIQVSPIAGAIGAEIAKINLTGNLPEDTIAEVRAALLEHLVIFLRDQDISDEDLARFGRQFGELAPCRHIGNSPESFRSF